MIGTVLRTGWLNLKRDPVAMLLTFIVPLALFSVFAAVFGSMDDAASRPVRTTVLLESQDATARRVADALGTQPTLLVSELPPGSTREDAVRHIRERAAAVAVVLPPDLGVDGGTGASIELLADTANPMALEVVRGVLQQTLPAALALAVPEGERPVAAAVRGPTFEVVDVLGTPGKRPSISYFAAGIGVMFLLFAVSGRGAILIDERESGVLVRMLTSKLGLPRLLAGRWLFLTLLGIVQVTLMFVWGALLFGLDLFTPRHLAGFALMTIATAAAAAGFALCLATLCRTRAQLSGLAVVLVLVMSALGGSMFPRFLMPENLQAAGRFTFNAWALDGYRKVFWYEIPPSGLWPELLLLGSLAVVFYVVALLLARRWRVA